MRKSDINWSAEIAASLIGYLLGALLTPLFRGLGNIVRFIFGYAIDYQQIRTDPFNPPLLEMLEQVFYAYYSLSGYTRELERIVWKGLAVWVVGGIVWRVISEKQERISRWIFWVYAYGVCTVFVAVSQAYPGLRAWIDVRNGLIILPAFILPAFVLAIRLVPLMRRVYLWLAETELESLFRRR